MTIFNVEGEEVTLDALVKFCFIKCNAVFALYGRLCSSAIPIWTAWFNLMLCSLNVVRHIPHQALM